MEVRAIRLRPRGPVVIEVHREASQCRRFSAFATDGQRFARAGVAKSVGVGIGAQRVRASTIDLRGQSAFRVDSNVMVASPEMRAK